MRSITYIRKVYQMAVISIVLVVLITVIIVVSLPSSSAQEECEALNMVVTIEPPSTVRLTWDANSCALAYNVTQFINGEAMILPITPDPITTRHLQWTYCSHNIVLMTIIPRVSGVAFTPEVTEFGIGIDGDGTVRNLRFDEENSRFLWDVPENFDENCDIQYVVDFKSEALTTQITTADEFYNVALYPCSTNIIDVTTHITVDDSFSTSVSLDQIGPVGRAEPAHVSTDPQFFSVAVTFQIENEPYNFCEIEALTFEIESADLENHGEFPTDFSTTVDWVEFSFTSLESETLYQHRACYTFVDSDIVICSPFVLFLTKPLTGPVLEDVVISDNSLEITWNQNRHEGFVSRNVVRIQPIGPNHFVSNECSFDLEAIEEEFEPEATTFNFENTTPSFIYNVTVITHFDTLGRTTTSNTEVIETIEETPGELDVDAFYQFTPNSPYMVSIKAEWPVPCDINGRLRSFTYTITSTLSTGIAADCLGVTLVSGDISTDLEQELHELSAPGILPFFDYTLTITTYLDAHEKTTTKFLGPAPQPYTPSISH